MAECHRVATKNVQLMSHYLCLLLTETTIKEIKVLNNKRKNTTQVSRCYQGSSREENNKQENLCGDF